MTSNQRAVLLALNLKQMQRVDSPYEGVWSHEVASVCGRSVRSVAVILSQVRDLRWVESIHASGEYATWRLTQRGVDALEADRQTFNSSPQRPPSGVDAPSRAQFSSGRAGATTSQRKEQDDG